MLKIAMRSLGAHKVRLLLTTAAVFLGVAFVTGMLMLTNALDRTFTDIFESGAQDVIVTKSDAVEEQFGDTTAQLIPQSTVEEVAAVEGVQAAAGAITANGAYLLDAEGKVVGGNGPPALGSNWQPDPALAVATITQGRAPERNSEIAVDDVTYPKLNLPVGQRGHDGHPDRSHHGAVGGDLQVRQHRRSGRGHHHHLHRRARSGTLHRPR